MKHLKLFFALFAMLALGVGNAWSAEVTVTKTTNTLVSELSWTVSSGSCAGCYTEFDLDNAITISTTGTPNCGSVWGTTTNDWRLYQNQNGNVIVSAKTGYELVSIKFTYSQSNSGTLKDGSTTVTTKTVVNCSGLTTKTLTVGNTGTKTNGQVRITEFSVTYTQTSADSGSEETVVSVPTFSVPEGTFYSPINVELSCETADAEIYYTLDGTTPSSTSEKYTNAIAISETTTVKAIAVKDGLTDSEVATATYTKGETVTSYDIDFEKNALEAYVNWDFSNIAVATTTITAKAGTYYGNTCGKASASIKTKTAIQYPGTLTFYTSKESGNTTSSNWIVQVSENGSTWTEVTSFDATTGSKGTWTERTADLSDYENVYVQISYSGSTAIRAIDEISLAQGVAPVKYTLTIENPENGTLSVTKGGVPVASGDQFKAGTSLVVTPTPASGYLFESLNVGGEAVELTEGSYTFNMPASDVTITATFKENEKPAATLTLSKNGVEETFPGSWKQDDVVTLPSIISDCVKEFVGWSANPTCNVAPEYAAGDSYTLAATAQTLYAVYAIIEGGGSFTITKTMSEIVSENGYTISSGSTATCYTTLTLDENITLSTTGSANCGSFWSDPQEWRLYQNKSGNAIVTATNGCSLTSVKFTFTNSNTGTLLNNGATMTSGTAVSASGTSATYVVGNSGTATNGQIRITQIEVVYTGGVSYSNYSTTCVAALDEPVFSVEGGENEAKTITLTATEGTIYYTLDGTTPTASSEKYTTPIVLDECGEHTIKAIAISSDSESPVASATYTIQLPIEKGTKASPLSVADVLAIYNGGCYNGTDEVYVTGTVSSASYNTTYSNYTVTLTDNSFQFYRLVDESNLVTTMQAGDVLIAKGKLGEYEGKCQLIECVLVNYKAYEGVKTDISNNVADPYTVEEAYALIDDVSSDLEKSNVYVKGIISKVDSYNSTYKSITYWISDDGTTTKQLQVYSGKGLDSTNFVSKNDLQVGDKVIVFGKLKKHETTYEFDYNNYLVSFERPEQEETVAALPFTFTGSLSDIENTDGMKQSGLGSYSTSLKLKFDDTGDYLTIHFDGEPGRLRYGIKGNPSNNVMSCTYKVQTSVDGTTYTDLETYTTLANTEKTMSHALNSDVRYVKFIFAEKKSGNVALGNITISQPAIVIGDDDNSSVIATAVAAGNPVDVIVNRSFTANAGYYTLCVPFNMPASVIGTAYKLGTITKHVSGEGININLAAVSTIEAGVPYLIEPNQTVSELLVENVTIVNTTGSDYTIVGDGVKIKFTGIINGVGETTNNSTEYYVGNGGYLYNGTVEKLGLRAFFTITDEAGNPTKVRARVVAGENVETGVEDIITTDAPVKAIVNGQLIIIRDGVKYNVQGQVIK